MAFDGFIPHGAGALAAGVPHIQLMGGGNDDAADDNGGAGPLLTSPTKALGTTLAELEAEANIDAHAAKLKGQGSHAPDYTGKLYFPGVADEAREERRRQARLDAIAKRNRRTSLMQVSPKQGDGALQPALSPSGAAKPPPADFAELKETAMDRVVSEGNRRLARLETNVRRARNARNRYITNLRREREAGEAKIARKAAKSVLHREKTGAAIAQSVADRHAVLETRRAAATVRFHDAATRKTNRLQGKVDEWAVRMQNLDAIKHDVAAQRSFWRREWAYQHLRGDYNTPVIKGLVSPRYEGLQRAAEAKKRNARRRRESIRNPEALQRGEVGMLALREKRELAAARHKPMTFYSSVPTKRMPHMSNVEWTQDRDEERALRRAERLEAAAAAKEEIERLEQVEARALAAQHAAKVRRREIECARLAAREKRRRDEGPLAEDGSDDEVIPGVEEEPFFSVQKLGKG